MTQDNPNLIANPSVPKGVFHGPGILLLYSSFSEPISSNATQHDHRSVPAHGVCHGSRPRVKAPPGVLFITALRTRVTKVQQTPNPKNALVYHVVPTEDISVDLTDRISFWRIVMAWTGFAKRMVLPAAVLFLIPVTVHADSAAVDLQTVRQRMIDALLKAAPEQNLQTVMAHLKDDGSWSDIDYASVTPSAWPPRDHLERMEIMARALVISHDQGGLRKATFAALDYWLAHDFHNPNWFWNQIGVPQRLSGTLLLLWDQMSPSEQSDAIKILSRAKIGSVGTNLVWLCQIAATRGILQGDADLVAQAYAKIANEVHIVPTRDNGEQSDDSFTFHGPLLYSWGYGVAFLHDNANLATLVTGTRFAYPTAKVNLIRDWTLDGSQWMTRGGVNDFGAEGREISRPNHTANSLIEIGGNLLAMHTGREDEIQSMIARVTNPDAPQLTGNKAFWRTDFMVHQRPNYYASARLYSARTHNTEWGNGEALQNFHIADGCNVLMKTGQEYYNIYPIWDWQKIPGTTVEQLANFGPTADGKFIPSQNTIVHHTKEKFVGSVSDGTCGIFGGRFTRDDLKANKAWFFFDDEYVCLGSGITCTGPDPVVTTLDQCFLHGKVSCDQVPNLGAAEHQLDHARWALHDRVGYVLLQPANVHIRNAEQHGSWHDIDKDGSPQPISKDVFKAWIDHGSQPKDATYAYAVVPVTDADAIDGYAAKPPVTVVANDSNTQAVWQSPLAAGGAVFYSAGEVELRKGLKLAVDQPCMVLVKEKGNTMMVSISNPVSQPLLVHAKVSRDGSNAETDFQLPADLKAGSTVTKGMSF
jgi:chondroitin AC lyase